MTLEQEVPHEHHAVLAVGRSCFEGSASRSLEGSVWRSDCALSGRGTQVHGEEGPTRDR